MGRAGHLVVGEGEGEEGALEGGMRGEGDLEGSSVVGWGTLTLSEVTKAEKGSGQ